MKRSSVSCKLKALNMFKYDEPIQTATSWELLSGIWSEPDIKRTFESTDRINWCPWVMEPTSISHFDSQIIALGALRLWICPKNVLQLPIYGHLCITNHAFSKGVQGKTPECISLSRVFLHSELATDCLTSKRCNAAFSWMAFGLLFRAPITRTVPKKFSR